MSSRAILLGILALALAGSACRKKEEALSLLVWEGYSDPSFVQAFEQRHHCKVQASYMGSSDELVAKLRGGSASNYDVISPSSDVAASLVSAGLAAPLDLGKIPSYSQLSPKLRELRLVKRNGQTYGVPFVWGPNPILYDTTAFARPPDSWSIFWDPRHKGKISLWDELSSVYMAAQVLGYDHPDPDHCASPDRESDTNAVAADRTGGRRECAARRVGTARAMGRRPRAGRQALRHGAPGARAHRPARPGWGTTA